MQALPQFYTGNRSDNDQGILKKAEISLQQFINIGKIRAVNNNVVNELHLIE